MSYKDVQAGVEEVRVGVRVLASTLKQMLLQQEELLVAVAGINAAYPIVHKGLLIARVLRLLSLPDNVSEDAAIRVPVGIVA